MEETDLSARALVIIPTYNERGTIERMVEATRSIIPGIAILIVDDNSPDGTGAVADMLAKKHKDLFTIHRDKKHGLGSAYIAGFNFAIEHAYEFACEMDADFSHDPNYLVAFFEKMPSSDLVIGSRYTDGISIVNWPFMRLVVSFFANKFVKLVLGMPFTDCMGGFKCIRTSVLKDINPDNFISYGYAFQMELLYRTYKKGYRISEVPIIFYNRKIGRSKMNIGEVLDAFVSVIRLRFRR